MSLLFDNRKLSIGVCSSDLNYMPQVVVVQGGKRIDNMTDLNTVSPQILFMVFFYFFIYMYRSVFHSLTLECLRYYQIVPTIIQSLPLESRSAMRSVLHIYNVPNLHEH